MTTSGDVFDPSTVEERIKVGEHELVIAPLKLKAFRKFIAALDAAIKNIALVDGKNSNSEVVDRIVGNSVEVFQALFPLAQHAFLTQDFIEENMTVPTMRHVMARAIVVNQVEDLFPFLVPKKPAA